MPQVRWEGVEGGWIVEGDMRFEWCVMTTLVKKRRLLLY